ncbi:hypothetical protein lbkm_1311 [Lachnospiraceae bacterium KM106-2]|nr:hypothetical protein lbkm_1311 [Lachnospiraceae bacterium KM106-2]
MKEFVPAARTDRRRQIIEYEKKGYEFINKNEFIYINKITVLDNDENYEYGIRLNPNEVYFYIINDGASIYLSIYEIYVLLKGEVSKGSIELLNVLKEYPNIKETTIFRYKGICYELKKLNNSLANKMINISKTSLKISYRQLVILIYLIQEKSNYLFGLSDDKVGYIDGLIRMLYNLLKINSENSFLKSLGWIYDSDFLGYKLVKEKKRGLRNKYRYYLTADEERSIL